MKKHKYNKTFISKNLSHGANIESYIHFLIYKTNTQFANWLSLCLGLVQN